MPEKKGSNQPGNQGGPQGEGQELSSQELIDARLGDLVARLLHEFDRRSTNRANRVNNLPPEVERDLAVVAAAFESIERALALAESPIIISSVNPSRGRVGERVTIVGSHFLPGSTVRFGNKTAEHVSVVCLTEIQATTPSGCAGAVDVVVTTLGGSARLACGYTYQS